MEPMRPLDRVRRVALALPGVNERTSHGEPCFFVRDNRPLCYFHENHNGMVESRCGAQRLMASKWRW